MNTLEPVYDLKVTRKAVSRATCLSNHKQVLSDFRLEWGKDLSDTAVPRV